MKPKLSLRWCGITLYMWCLALLPQLACLKLIMHAENTLVFGFLGMLAVLAFMFSLAVLMTWWDWYVKPQGK